MVAFIQCLETAELSACAVIKIKLKWKRVTWTGNQMKKVVLVYMQIYKN